MSVGHINEPTFVWNRNQPGIKAAGRRAIDGPPHGTAICNPRDILLGKMNAATIKCQTDRSDRHPSVRR